MDFIKNFPDFMKYQESKNNNIFNIQAFLRTPEQINNYIEIIKKKLKAHTIKVGLESHCITQPSKF